MFRLLLIFFLLTGTLLEVSAQRLIPGQDVFSLSVVGWKQPGGAFNWGRCSKIGNTSFGLQVLSGPRVDKYIPATKDSEAINETYRPIDMLAQGGFLARVVGTRSRSVNLYLGGTFDIGLRLRRTFSGGVKTEEKGGFIYGLSPRANIEFFVSRNISLGVFATAKMQFYSQRRDWEKWFLPQFGIMINFYSLPR